MQMSVMRSGSVTSPLSLVYYTDNDGGVALHDVARLELSQYVSRIKCMLKNPFRMNVILKY